MAIRPVGVVSGLLLLAASMPCASPRAEIRQDLRGFTGTEFAFESEERLYWDEILQNKRDRNPKVAIEAELFFPPAGTEPFPAVVLMHGSGGRGARLDRYARTLNDEGFAAVVLDSFGPRGVRTIGGRQEQVSTASMIGDVYALLEILDSHPRIDGARVAIVGFSKGGSVAMLSADEKVRKNLAKGDRRFAAHVAFYPGCVIKLKQVESTGSPLLVLLGAYDSYTPAEQCERYIARMRAADFPVQSITYANAHHGWDSDYPVRKSSFDFSYGDCEVEVDEKGRGLDGKTGAVINTRDRAAVRKWIAACGVPGVWLGGNQEAREKSLADLKAFLSENLRE